MTPSHPIAFIGNSLPRRCGIATFTTDLQQAVARSGAGVETAIVAMTDHGQVYDYPPSVLRQIHAEDLADYIEAAEALNAGPYATICLQHEFGIFGGEAGGYILALVERLKAPLVTTFHTVLAEPTPAQRHVMQSLLDASARVVVMADKARELLRSVYAAAGDKIEVIPHGVPDVPMMEPDVAKVKLGFSGRSVILTFGLLSPNKGIEVMIDAMPAILRRQPDAVYVVLGASHPNLVRREGETYRESLMTRARDLGVEDHVVFLDRFVDLPTLLEFISMSDVYVTPYLNEAQMTSGTLAYSFGLGKAVVSTPYWHARELLSDDRGVLVPFGDSAAIGVAIADLLTDDARRQVLRERAYAASRSMTWGRTAERYLALFDRVRRERRLRVIPPTQTRAPPDEVLHPPEIRTGHFQSMCDDVGLFQHAMHATADRSHGYCVDDNARALILSCALTTADEPPLPEILTGRFAAFIQHAWNPDTHRFRNFMSFDRRWLEDRGSEDSHGRTLWALGECARRDASPSRRRWAIDLFAEALPGAEPLSAPRTCAFTLLGLEGYCTAVAGDAFALHTQGLLADRLMAIAAQAQTPEWVWFEPGLAYDNARLCQALIVTGAARQNADYIETGLRTLRWLTEVQTSEAGLFRPVGSRSFGDVRQPPKHFDQQPLEATATISACLAALRVSGENRWRTEAERAFAWFFGGNDLGLPLVDLETGGCRDGLHPDRVNQNQGAESVVSYLISLTEMRTLNAISGDAPPHTALQAVRR